MILKAIDRICEEKTDLSSLHDAIENSTSLWIAT